MGINYIIDTYHYSFYYNNRSNPTGGIDKTDGKSDEIAQQQDDYTPCRATYWRRVGQSAR